MISVWVSKVRGRSGIRAFAALGALGLAFGTAGTGQAEAGTTPTFQGLASAYGFDATLSNPSIPLGLTLQGAGPVAQASLSPIKSDAFASFPYPGDTIANLPGVAGAAFLNGFPLPPYPLYINSSLGDPDRSSNFPGITLEAHSGRTQADAVAALGTDGFGYTSTADVRLGDDGRPVATARTEITGLRLGGVVEISGMVSTVSVRMAADGSLERTSSLSIGRIGVPGLQLTLPHETPSSAPIPVPIPGVPQVGSIPLVPLPIPLGGTTIAAPDIGFVDGTFTVTLPGIGALDPVAVPAAPVLDALGALGIEASYQPAVETADGLVGASLRISTRLPAPPENQIANGETVIAYDLGRATASLGAPQGARPAARPSSAPSSTGSATPVAGGPSTGLGNPAIARPAAPATVSEPASVAAPLTAGSISFGGFRLPSMTAFYLVFVGIAAAGAASSHLLRLLGVRT